MRSGNDGVLTLTIKMKVSPEPDSQEKLINLMQRYRDALNYSIRKIIENKALSLSKTHNLLYNNLKEKFGLPSRIAIDSYREALAIAKSWLGNQNKGEIPKAKNLRIWLTYNQSYRVNEEYVEILGGFKLKIVGWDRRYDGFPNKEARLVFRDNKFILYIFKRIPKSTKYSPKDILAVDVNEKYIVVGNSKFEYRLETTIERAFHYKQLAENLQRKYSSTRYNGWIRRRNIRKRIRDFYRKAKNIIEDCVKKISHRIIVLAKQNQYALAREDLTGLVENLRKLPRDHRVSLLMLSYRKLEFWIDWQAEKHGVPVVVIKPNGTSSICPKCGSKLKENSYRTMKCSECSLEADRDTIAVMNIKKKALSKIGGSLTTPTASQMTDVAPNRCEEPMNCPKGNPRPLGWEEVSGSQIYGDRVRMDFNLEKLDDKIVRFIEERTNEIVEKDLPVFSKIISKEEVENHPELKRLMDESKYEKFDVLRIVGIGDIDLQLDRGTRVKSTKEVGRIKIVKRENKGKNNKRITVVAE